jgi:hypothetical protein
MAKFSIPRPSIICQNWDFWFANKPSGNPGARKKQTERYNTWKTSTGLEVKVGVLGQVFSVSRLAPKLWRRRQIQLEGTFHAGGGEIIFRGKKLSSFLI